MSILQYIRQTAQIDMGIDRSLRYKISVQLGRYVTLDNEVYREIVAQFLEETMRG